jgi:hypothetical protein
MPAHYKRLCSAIDAIPPDIHLELSDLGATGDEEVGLLDPPKATPETSVP